jgi:acetoin utilization protein AcuB
MIMKRNHVREIMRPAVEVDQLDSLGEAYQAMRTNGVRHLAVLRSGRLAGIVSERDLLEYRAVLGFAEGWRDHGVSGVMTRSPRTVGPDESIVDVAARLASSRLGALPVVEHDTLIGMITIGDVLGAEAAAEPRSARARVAADVMTPGPFTATADERLLDAARRMSVHGIRHLPVVDDSGGVIGILSERDVRTAVGDPERFVLSGARVALRVRDAMSPDPLRVDEHRPIVELAQLFQDRHIGAVPIVDRAGNLVGIVSYVDALRALAATRAGA